MFYLIKKEKEVYQTKYYLRLKESDVYNIIYSTHFLEKETKEERHRKIKNLYKELIGERQHSKNYEEFYSILKDYFEKKIMYTANENDENLYSDFDNYKNSNYLFGYTKDFIDKESEGREVKILNYFEFAEGNPVKIEELMKIEMWIRNIKIPEDDGYIELDLSYLIGEYDLDILLAELGYEKVDGSSNGSSEYSLYYEDEEYEIVFHSENLRGLKNTITKTYKEKEN